MNNKKENNLSKFMSLILRHKPKEFGINLDQNGYCLTEDLLRVIQSQPNWSDTSMDDIFKVVANCPKQRYKIVGETIGARYGHSKQKDNPEGLIISYEEKIPPKVLFHGTNDKALKDINETGIQSMSRERVHLSETTHFATLAGKRRGNLVILKIDTEKALEKGSKFHYADGEVWLANFIPNDCFEIYE